MFLFNVAADKLYVSQWFSPYLGASTECMQAYPGGGAFFVHFLRCHVAILLNKTVCPLGAVFFFNFAKSRRYFT